jgi:hypothetical protein
MSGGGALGWIGLWDGMRLIVQMAHVQIEEGDKRLVLRVTDDDEGKRLAAQMVDVGWSVNDNPAWTEAHPPDWEEIKVKGKDAQMEAHKLLQRLLVANKIAGTGVHVDGQRKPITEEQWGTLRIDISTSTLCTPGWDTAAEFPPVKAVRIKASDLQRAVAEALQTEPEAAPTEPAKPGNGAVERPHIPAGQLNILRVADSQWPTGDVPSRVTDRNNKIRAAFKAKGETEPSDKTIGRAFAKTRTKLDN